LVERLGTNQQMLSSELNKVALYDKNITKKSIEINTEAIPQSSIFELLDSVFSGDSKRALTLYREQRALQVEPIQIISMLVWQFQIVALIKASKGLTSDQIARESKNSPYTVAKTMRIASKISLTQLRRMIHDLLELDVKRKTQKIDDDEALQHYILSIYNK
jgi:DNA polymerase-3 subunit delta